MSNRTLPVPTSPPQPPAPVKPGAGYNAQVQALVDGLAAQAVQQIDTIRQASGAPWGSSALPRREALARIATWDQPRPDVQQSVAKMDLGDVLHAALDAVKLRREAEKRGEWTAPTPTPTEPGASA